MNDISRFNSKIVDLLFEIKNTFGDKMVVFSYEEKILKLKSSFLSLVFASNIEGSDIKKHQQVVIDSKEALFNYHFAREVEGIDITPHEEIVLASNDLHLIYQFALNVKGVDIEKYRKIIEDSKNEDYIMLFRKYIDGSENKGVNMIKISGTQSYKSDKSNDNKMLKLDKILDKACNKLEKTNN